MAGQLLTEDNADLRALLADALGRLWYDPAAYPTIASLADENETLSGLVERLIHALHADGLDGPARTATEVAMRACLARQVERERPLYAPAFSGPPF